MASTKNNFDLDLSIVRMSKNRTSIKLRPGASGGKNDISANSLENPNSSNKKTITIIKGHDNEGFKFEDKRTLKDALGSDSDSDEHGALLNESYSSQSDLHSENK